MIRKLILPAVAVLFLAGCWGNSDDKAATKEKGGANAQNNTQTMQMQPSSDQQQGAAAPPASQQGAAMNGQSESAVPQKNNEAVQPMPQQQSSSDSAPMDRVAITEEAVTIQPMNNNNTMAVPASPSSQAMPHTEPMMHNAQSTMDHGAVGTGQSSNMQEQIKTMGNGMSDQATQTPPEGAQQMQNTVQEAMPSGNSTMQPQNTMTPSSTNNMTLPSSNPEVQPNSNVIAQ